MDCPLCKKEMEWSISANNKFKDIYYWCDTCKISRNLTCSSLEIVEKEHSFFDILGAALKEKVEEFNLATEQNVESLKIANRASVLCADIEKIIKKEN